MKNIRVFIGCRTNRIAGVLGMFTLFLAVFIAGCGQDNAATTKSSNEASGAASATKNTADTILSNGMIYTVDDNKPWAESIAIKDDRIIAVGSNADVSGFRGERTQHIDLAGRFVMPGFTDSHLHFMMGGKYLSHVPLRDASTMAEVQRRVAAYAKQHPDKPWITGDGFSYGYPDLPNGEFHSELLDQVVPDRPVFLTSPMAHAAWANSKALALAGITKASPDPVDGEIVRGSNNEPTGWLKESAWTLPQAAMPKATKEEELSWLRAGIAEANRLGVTRVVSAGWDLPHVEQLHELRQAGQLSLRFSLSEAVTPGMGIQDLTAAWYQTLESKREKYQDDFISVGAVKFIMDGVIESHTGYLPAGYADKPGETGMAFWEQEAFNSVVLALHQRDFQILTHAIGDGAIQRALDAYEAARKVVNKPLRHRIEHGEAPNPEDIPRFRELGVVASIQPLMIYPRDEWKGMEGLWARRAGEQHLPQYFAVRSFLDGGVNVAFGTDWPVVQLNPLLGLRNAVLRQSLDGQPQGGYVPEQRITIAEAIRAYTLGAAYATHREQDEGSIAMGKLADLIVLSDNLLAIDPNDIASVTVESTMIGGNIVYQRSE